jgi:lipopolysaccharide/colanic/teichoic acid biosynthesis glycosyltransferase
MFYLATSNIFHTKFAVVCSDERHQKLTREITINPQLGYAFRGSFETLSKFFENKPDVDLVIIHKTALDESELLEKLFSSRVDVIDLSEAYEKILYRIPVHFIDNFWIISSIRKQGDTFYRAFSRIISITFAVVVGIITIPISLVIMLAIKLEDNGPIFIRQERVGLHGTIFKLYKFRSMKIDAEKNNATWAAQNDIRVTKTGKIIRKLHVDEIPQLINILKGNITLVGPRPERPEFVANLEKEIPYYFMRHAIMPGFTGWAQIKFRYARTVLDSEEKFEYDLFYIKNRNIFLDLGIVLKTIQIIFTH